MKKQLHLMIATIFVVLVGISSYGQQFTVDGIRYEITATAPAQVEVVDYIGATTEVTIPSTVRYQLVNYAVTAIGDEAFFKNHLTSVTIGNSVTRIGSYAFYGNLQLTNVTIGNNVTRIGSYAFTWSQLTNVTIGNNVTSIGSHAFAYNELTEVIIPNSVTRIEVAAFAVNRLTSVTIPSSVTSIANYAFHRNQLTSVTLPNTLTDIGTHAFHTNQLTSVTLPNSLKTIGNSAFWDNDLTGVTLPVNVTRIDQWAFWDNPNLVTVRARSTNNPLPTLDKDAFKNRGQIDLVVPKGRVQAYSGHPDWTGFRSITEVAVDDTFISDNITYKITEIVPDKEVVVMDYDTSGGSSVDIPPTVNYQGIDFEVTDIGEATFAVNQLTSVTLPNSLETIGNYAFQNNQLTRVTIPNNVTGIGTHAFQNNQLTSVTLPNSLETIGNSAFWDNDLTEVTLPVNVTRIDQWAFWDNLNLAMVTVKADSPPTLDKDAFKNRGQIHLIVPKGRVPAYSAHPDWTGFKSITEVVKVDDTFILDNITYKITEIVPDKEVAVMDYDTSGGTMVTIPPMVAHGLNTYTVTAIGKWAFYLNNLTSVTIPNTVTRIGHSAFQDNQLTEVIIPNSVTRIDGDAFEHNQLTSVVIPIGIEIIQPGTFKDNKLSSVTIPEGVTRIESSAFGGNQLTSVTIPEGVASIADDAFYRNQLESVTLPNSLETIGNSAFSFNLLTSVTIPDGVTHILDDAFSANMNLNLVTVKANNPPSLHVGAFHDAGRHQIDLVVPEGRVQAYSGHPDWMGFKSITEDIGIDDTFISDNITYKITKTVPDKEVAVMDYDTSGGTMVTISPMVAHGPNTYTVTAIGKWAFYVNNLTSVTIPNTVTGIGESAFENNQLTRVVIPNGVMDIGKDAFYGNQLTSVELPTSVDSLGQRAFGDNHLTSVTIPDGVTRIEKWTFAENDLKEVTIPGLVESIGDQAFYDNPNLGLVTVKRNDPPALDANAFQNPGRDQIDLVVPKGKRQDYIDADWTGFRSITEPAEHGDTFIVDNISYEITSLTSYKVKVVDYGITGGTVTIPPTANYQGIDYEVTAIGEGAFYQSGLTSVEIPNTVTSIGESAFENNQLTRVVIPNGVMDIGKDAFSSNELTSVTLSENVTSIGEYAFWNNQLQGHLEIPDSVISIGDFAFDYNQLTSVTLGENVTSIGEYAFWNNQLQGHLEIPDSVISIGEWAFYGNELVSVTIGNSVTSIGDYAFWNNQLQGHLEIPDNVTAIGNEAFKENQLTSVTIGNSVTRIGWGAFAGNQLTEVTIPGSVESIANIAFAGNPGLRTVEVKAANPPSLHVDAFQNADRDQIDLIVPSGTKSAYLAAGWTDFKSITEAAMTGKSAVAQGTSPKASPVESAVAPADVDVAKANARNNVSVYPNPAQDDIHIGLPDGEALRQVKIYNALGVHVHSANTLQMDISHLSSGIYMLEIETRAGERVVKRILVK
ncbi:leucine-rich repeat protein [Muricauda sp. SCSIO 64092]|uniref:leucine-rich repeat domain-containing protein n=1 Tax=Allomuricauda sp. SCSIO 64092 TaxID=2908842 RepID=UPI001FF5A783|nr:leucine-rich repeat domain-containing protein [Muricauda sp. SCSIO 64092]UOY07232.1 leucine-rich repeat protein [Muricauda sp. SCSIO 64092]